MKAIIKGFGFGFTSQALQSTEVMPRIVAARSMHIPLSLFADYIADLQKAGTFFLWKIWFYSVQHKRPRGKREINSFPRAQS